MKVKIFLASLHDTSGFPIAIDPDAPVRQKVRFFADLPSTVEAASTPAFDGSGSVVLQAIVYSAAGDTTESSDYYGPAVTLDGCP
ncbi:hypothetical protein [Sorangium sp. So ce693]|uniref:hypothetical protein n=1 Tax=Sorangium sp. So ce693 TaxID=3133318 RepID=UPI003F640E0A